MAYRHITSCVPVGKRKSKVEVMLAHGVAAGTAGAAVGLLLAGGVGALIGFGSTVGVAVVTGFCDWWFHYRLICIRDDQCAVGTVGRAAVSRGLDDPDLDYTIDLVLAPVARASNLKAAAQLPLLAPEHRKYLEPFFAEPKLEGVDAMSTVDEDDVTDKVGTTALHCEIEGDGMKAACAAGTIGAAVGAAGGAAAGIAIAAGCAATGIFFFFCLLIALIAAALISLLGAGAGWAIGVLIGGTEGSPADVGEPGTVEVGDYVAILGDWIYDSAHDGWHELHPVKELLTLPRPSVTADDPRFPEAEREHLRQLEQNMPQTCEMLRMRRDPAVRSAQSHPQNRWVAHPRLG